MAPSPVGQRLPVPEALAGQRLDRALATLLPAVSRTRLQAAIKAGAVRVDGRTARPALLLEAGQLLEVALEASGSESGPIAAPQAEAIPLRIVFEDDALLVIDKPAGMVVHPAPGHSAGTLVNALLAHVPTLHGGEHAARPGIVHRLDKDTSGLLVIAKDAQAHAQLAAQMQERSPVKRYLALVEGYMPNAEGAIEAPIGRDPRHRQRMALVSVARGGRDARTRFRVLAAARGRSLVELHLETGRTHQIRVHLAAVHHPVVGDATYGHPHEPQPPRIFLHAGHLEFRHPRSGEWLAFDAPLPPDLASYLRALDDGLYAAALAHPAATAATAAAE